ncbi:MAG: eL32 family ribosomal protein [Candidatus Aenigmatarchaeota archaeon]
MTNRKFIIQDYFRYKRLGKKWRRPKGRQSKMREKRKGKRSMPTIGYGTKKSERHKIKGMKYVVIKNINDLEKIKKDHVIILSSGIGAKKVLKISERAKELGIKILNMKKVRRAEKIMKSKEKK